MLSVAHHGQCTVDIIHPVTASSDTEVKGTVVVVDVTDAVRAFGVRETSVGFSNLIHHLFHDDRLTVEAEAPGHGRVRLVPVDDEDYLILTLANPVTDTGRVNGSILLCKQAGRKQTEDSKKEQKCKGFTHNTIILGLTFHPLQYDAWETRVHLN